MQTSLFSTTTLSGGRRPRLYVDIETRGRVDLKRAGQYAYAEDRFTQIILMSWAIDDEEIATWQMLSEPMPARLREAFLNDDVILVAHNASFERILLSVAAARTSAVPPEVIRALRPIGRWSCTAARAAALGLPRTLDGAARALGLSVTKDSEGRLLMLRMCVPLGLDMRGLPVWRESPAELVRLGLYCEVDVAVERCLDRVLPDLIAPERKTWETTEGINDRGIMVDSKLLSHLIPLVDEAERDVNQRLRDATDGQVPKVTNHLKLRKWLVAQGYEDFETTGVGKAAVSDALLAFSSRDDLTNHETLIRDILLMRQEGGKSSSAKYKAIIARMNRDSKARGAMVFCGAASTGRYSSRGIALQNLPRGGSVENIGQALLDVMSGMPLALLRHHHAPPLVVASELLRPTFIAPDDCWLARGDYSQIEMRVNYWLAGDRRKVDSFRAYDTIVGVDPKGKSIRGGPDMYCVTAEGITGRPVGKDDPERQYGKVLGLACGFLGGVGAFQAFAKLYQVKIEDDRATELVKAWREDNQKIMQLGWDLDAAAQQCARSRPGFEIEVRPTLRFRRTAKAMTLRLPSGRNLIYWAPRLEKQATSWGTEKLGVTYLAEDPKTKQWSRQRGWGGIWLENCLTADTEVLTPRGWVALICVTPTDKVWDGEDWVSHDGLTFKGFRKTIDFGGVGITPDHKVLVDGRWAHADATSPEAAVGSYQRHHRNPPQHAGGGTVYREGRTGPVHMAVPVRLRRDESHADARFPERRREVLRVREITYDRCGSVGAADNSRVVDPQRVSGVEQHGAAVQNPTASRVPQLRRPWDFGVRLMAHLRGFLGRYGAVLRGGVDDRTSGRERELPQGQLRLGHPHRTGPQQTWQRGGELSVGSDDRRGSGRPSRYWEDDGLLPNLPRVAGKSAVRSTRFPKSSVVRPVYDLVNAGPRHRFTIRTADHRPFVVSNCVQATARDVMTYALNNLADLGLGPVLTVHDEIVCQIPKVRCPDAKSAAEAVRSVMVDAPSWARGLPVAVDASAGPRYVKA